MKNFLKGSLLVSLLSLSHSLFSQNLRELPAGYYVIVASYSPTREDLAKNFVKVLQRKGHHPGYGFNSKRGYYYVYLNRYNDIRESLLQMGKLRAGKEFKDAWVRVVAGDLPVENSVASAETTVSTTPDLIKTETVAVEEIAEEPVEEIKPDDTVQITENEEIIQYAHVNLENTEVFLSLFNARNNRILDGNVKVIDEERSKLIKEVKGNEYLKLPDPKSKSGKLTLTCEIFGYRKVQNEINFNNPLADTVGPNIEMMGTTLLVNFDMVRYQRGDVSVLYNVYFFNDAAVMLPESKYEVNNLVSLMEENPKYKIRLHGHTNGNYHGRIITIGPDKNFFSLTGSKQSIGTAKDLSRQRAEVIRDYLVANGIAADRIETKAWGGGRPLHDKHSANAKKNVRVEVEIAED